MKRIGRKLLAYMLGVYIGTGLLNSWNPLLWSKSEWAAGAVAMGILLVVTETWRWGKTRHVSK